MCGYSGFINFDKQNSEQNNIQNLKKMLNQIKFRGPDDSDTWNYKNLLFIGHNRLSIMDLSKKGSQPMISQNNRYVIAYNGEIYNHLTLRQNIRDRKNFFWNSTSDTETILEYVNLFGLEKSLESFEGMFSFALFDKIEKVFILVLDILFAIVEINVESIPPDKNDPTDTSEISCELTLENNNFSSSFIQSFSELNLFKS